MVEDEALLQQLEQLEQQEELMYAAAGQIADEQGLSAEGEEALLKQMLLRVQGQATALRDQMEQNRRSQARQRALNPPQGHGRPSMGGGGHAGGRPSTASSLQGIFNEQPPHDTSFQDKASRGRGNFNPRYHVDENGECRYPTEGAAGMKTADGWRNNPTHGGHMHAGFRLEHGPVVDNEARDPESYLDRSLTPIWTPGWGYQPGY